VVKVSQFSRALTDVGGYLAVQQQAAKAKKSEAMAGLIEEAEGMMAGDRKAMGLSVAMFARFSTLAATTHALETTLLLTAARPSFATCLVAQ
jgi:hypothetical protein